jgi:hypothetical protein
MERTHSVTACHTACPESLGEEASAASEQGVDVERRTRQLSLLQEWRRVFERAGYGTQLSVLPPMVLHVRTPAIEDRWIAISPNGLLTVFEKDDSGRVRSDYHLLPKAATAGSVGPSARDALKAACKYLCAG